MSETNSIILIATALKTLAAAVTGIASARDYGVKEIAEYEMIDVLWDGGDFEDEALKTFMAHYVFILTIYIYATDIQQIQTKQKTHAWNLLKKLKDYPDLNGNADRFTITAIKNGIVENNARGYAFSEFAIIVDKEETIT